MSILIKIDLNLSAAPKRMSENKENQHGRKSNRQSHANVMRRKSIFIKNVSIFMSKHVMLSKKNMFSKNVKACCVSN